jgi:hypothetical protein
VYGRLDQNGVWGVPTAISAPGFATPGAGVAVGAQTSTQNDLFVVGIDGKVYTTSQTNGGPWGTTLTALTAKSFATQGALLTTAAPGGQLAVLVVDATGKLEVIQYSAAHGWQAPVALTAAIDRGDRHLLGRL